jgi:hypothetical protein
MSYFEDEPGRRSAAKLLSKDESREIASNARIAAKYARMFRNAIISGGRNVSTPGSQSKLVTTVWTSKYANFGVAIGHWCYDSH